MGLEFAPRASIAGTRSESNLQRELLNAQGRPGI
jgi:hypothetical protein